jgi:hypothetical protein
MKFVDELRNEPILLAHHPLCGKFDDHMLNIKGRKVCRGCVTVYPTAILIFFSILFIRPEFEPIFIVSLVLFGIQLIRFLYPGHLVSIIFNIILGSSLASVLYSAIICPNDLRIYVYTLIAAVIVSFEYFKGRRMLDKCHNCPDHGSFPNCARGSEGHKTVNNGK